MLLEPSFYDQHQHQHQHQQHQHQQHQHQHQVHHQRPFADALKPQLTQLTPLQLQLQPAGSVVGDGYGGGHSGGAGGDLNFGVSPAAPQAQVMMLSLKRKTLLQRFFSCLYESKIGTEREEEQEDSRRDF